MKRSCNENCAYLIKGNPCANCEYAEKKLELNVIAPKVTAKTYWCSSWSDRIEFELDFGDGEPMKITFRKKNEEFYTDERDDAWGCGRWLFFAPEQDCDTEALGYLREWFETTRYMDVFKELNLCEGTSPIVPGASFSKGDLWNYFNDVLIIVERTAYDI